MIRSALLLSAAIFATSAAHAGDNYIQVHGGSFSLTDDDIRFQQSTLTGTPVSGPDGGDYDSGSTFGVLIGYRLFPDIVLEGEATKRTADLDMLTFSGAEPAGVTLENAQEAWAFMANVVWEPDLPIPLVTPYVGVGIGYALPALEGLRGENPDDTIAYQIKGGIRINVPVIPGEVGLEANHFATEDVDVPGLVETSAGIEETDYIFAFGGTSVLFTYRIGF
ncbi:outer membrane beta-barrel protein [Parvularcula lutaonensis]|uniref:Outer membrane beta-barrel protein n=1 Tax=Parvularcula lutaonensis TaxID=491923 RepID=A0ABV7M8N5_9PROT|nr:outer membrane beta-barrel protein [Parvularcula lutaonensis]GGY41124.1 hypothetical protein GCM10007148_07130 [Parvularcula lutaonensis]